MNTIPTLHNYINGQWCASTATEYLEVINPATIEILAKVPLSPASEVNQAADAAASAFVTWRRTPPPERVQYLFKLKNLLEEHFEDLARTITLECGKTLAESKGEMRRAIENVEVACGIPMMMQGTNLEDVGRGDRTTQSLLSENTTEGKAKWVAKASGVIAGLPVAARVFQLLNQKVSFVAVASEGQQCEPGQVIAEMQGSLDALLIGERVALNLAMRLSGIATLTHKYTAEIADLPAQLVDTRKTTPGLRILEKYATAVGGAINHRMGLDDAVMIKDNHIAAAGGIGEAINRIRSQIPYPLTIEVETESLDQVKEALQHKADIIMLDNMPLDLMREAVQMIRHLDSRVKIEASGNVTLETLRAIAQTGVDYISSSAPITQSNWLDLSMKIQ